MMTNYQKARVKLTNTLLDKLNSTAKKVRPKQHQEKQRKKFQDEELPYELFLTTTQPTFDVLGKSHESSLKVLTLGTYREP